MLYLLQTLARIKYCHHLLLHRGLLDRHDHSSEGAQESVWTISSISYSKHVDQIYEVYDFRNLDFLQVTVFEYTKSNIQIYANVRLDLNNRQASGQEDNFSVKENPQREPRA